jgi:hypothetical protein
MGPTSGTPYWFGDAILIRRYGGTYNPYKVGNATLASTSEHYISWQNTGGNINQPYWRIFKPNVISADVVGEVGSTSVPNAGYTKQAPQFLPWLTPVVTTVPAPLTPLPAGGAASMTFSFIGPLPAGGAAVTLSSTNQSVLPVPQFVTLSGGVSSFQLNVVAGTVTTNTLVQVTASYYGTTSSATVIVAPQQQ